MYCVPSWKLYSGGSAQSLSRVWLFATPWIAARQASLSITNSRSSLKLMPIESVMPSSHLILCYPLLFLPPVPPSITVFSNESTLLILVVGNIKNTNNMNCLERRELELSWRISSYWARKAILRSKLISTWFVGTKICVLGNHMASGLLKA